MRAKFLGRDTNGFERGKKYVLKTGARGDKVYVRDTLHPEKCCLYSDVEGVLRNWKVLEV